MPTKKYKPVTPGFRQRQVVDTRELSNNATEKKLLGGKVNQKSGRNNTGKITLRRRGGGHKKKHRLIDFKTSKIGVEGIVKTIEYDPNRSAYISLIFYKDGDKKYVITPQGLKIGDIIKNDTDSDIKKGNRFALKDIPVGSVVFNVELKIGKGAQIARSAGTSVTVMGKNDKYATLKLPSGEMRLVHELCEATIGQVSNSEKRNEVVGKAGASRWKGKRPKVRGAVMNPCDHPHGGGEGRAPVGHATPRSLWGKPTLGYKTRNKKKHSKKYIISKR